MANGPSGLTIYFVANSALGIIEHKRIPHIEKHDLLNLDKIRARREGIAAGFFGRLQQMVEQQRKGRRSHRQRQAEALNIAIPPTPGLPYGHTSWSYDCAKITKSVSSTQRSNVISAGQPIGIAGSEQSSVLYALAKRTKSESST